MLTVINIKIRYESQMTVKSKRFGTTKKHKLDCQSLEQVLKVLSGCGLPTSIIND